jgi:hypothetical protein
VKGLGVIVEVIEPLKHTIGVFRNVDLVFRRNRGGMEKRGKFASVVD